MDEHLVTGLPALEPYARLFHRYYAIASPSATRRLLLGLLEAPPSWAPDALDAIVQLLELLRAAEDYASRMRVLVDMILLPDWVFESAAQELRVMEQDATPHHPRIYLSDAQADINVLQNYG
ncbi:protein GIGANTEA isoform X2 [Lactuca sativa]|uniref:protein GIGANTEA isoform X2 n=1 Tax=Lactuca sativa TaxID=4236 RepID=UPI001C68B821|nr:protein GIGANTEA isoform X2 [Lactuca sativa]